MDNEKKQAKPRERLKKFLAKTQEVIWDKPDFWDLLYGMKAYQFVPNIPDNAAEVMAEITSNPSYKLILHHMNYSGTTTYSELVPTTGLQRSNLSMKFKQMIAWGLVKKSPSETKNIEDDHHGNRLMEVASFELTKFGEYAKKFCPFVADEFVREIRKRDDVILNLKKKIRHLQKEARMNNQKVQGIVAFVRKIAVQVGVC